ncbi:MAG TPA: MarR family transcriptional regulator [Rhizomicrobium sp.]|jgi:CRP-like cAMP-binding protein
MKAIALDPHVIDALMRDLVGHDRTPAAFIVYLWLWRRTVGAEKRALGISLQHIAHATGLSKSAVQAAVKRLKARRLISVHRAGPTLAPTYKVHTPWRD